jgi:quinol monooxygenase YgiN
MVTKGLIVRMDVAHGKDADVEEFLRSAVPLVREEPATVAWFAVRFGRSEYGIVDFFPDAAGRDAHLGGRVAGALMERSDALFERAPQIDEIDVLASKLPDGDVAQQITKGLLLTFAPKSGHEDQVADFLRGALPIVQDEAGTIAWFAIRLPDGRHGIFDVFEDNRGRIAHMAGGVPRELMKHALTLLGGIPDMDLLNVVAAEFARDPAAVR